MKSLNEHLTDLRYFDLRNKPISRQVEYYAYKEGKMAKFKTKEEALKFSNLTECVVHNEEEIIERKDRLRTLYSLAESKWKDELYQEMLNLYGSDENMDPRFLSIVYDYLERSDYSHQGIESNMKELLALILICQKITK